MNIFELAQEAEGADSDRQYSPFMVSFIERFANAVIKARDAELLKDVGEPVYGSGTIQLYTTEAVAGVVAKALAKADYAHIPDDAKAVLVEQEKRIAELESERDMWKATAEAVVDVEKSQMRLRIESLESARVAYAREFPLNADGEPDVGNIHANIRAMKDALRVALDSLENSVDCVRAEYETDWRHGMPTRKAQLDSMKQDYEAHEAAIKQIK